MKFSLPAPLKVIAVIALSPALLIVTVPTASPVTASSATLPVEFASTATVSAILVTAIVITSEEVELSDDVASTVILCVVAVS